MAKLRGQKVSSAFWSGFVASGFAAPKSFGVFKGTMITSVTSGTVSRLTGGKFANGAVTGAFVHLFNDMMDPRLNGSTGRAAGGNAGISDAQAAQNDATSVNIVLTITGGLSSGGRYVLNALWSEMRVAGSYFMSSVKGMFYTGSAYALAYGNKVGEAVVDFAEGYLPGVPSMSSSGILGFGVDKIYDYVDLQNTIKNLTND